MKIRIAIWLGQKVYSVHADDSTNTFVIGFNMLNTGVKDFVSKAINIVSAWPDEINGEPIKDGIKFKIAYNDGKNERQLVGSDNTPQNFEILIDLIDYYKNMSNKNSKDLAIEEDIKKLKQSGYIDPEM